MEKYIVTIKENGSRLDKCLTFFIKDKSRSFLATLIDSKNVFVNDKNVPASYKVKTLDVILVNIPSDTKTTIQSEDIPLDIVYEDKDIIIINKPQGMVVHPANGHHEGTLVNAILSHSKDLSSINGVIRPGIVHRIDKDTSGLICVAKNDTSHQELAKQLKTHSMARTYIALVKGVILENSGTVNMPISRAKTNRLKMEVNKEGKEAITNFEVLERYKDATLIRCSLVTGRTHQIRVHMAQIGHPIEGDPLYYGRGYNRYYKNGQLLVAYKLNLTHPSLKKEMEFEIKLPQYLLDVIENLK